MVSKTREKLIDVARQLFAKKGLEKTTMNDIANASDKGRRTIYTYFKNKREIYNAVIESESETLVRALREVQLTSMPPCDKLRLFIERRFELVHDTVRHTTIKALLSFDYRKVERIQQSASEKVNAILDAILDDGVKSGDFDPEQASRLRSMMEVAVYGLDSLYYRHSKDNYYDATQLRQDLVDFVIASISSPRPCQEQ